MLPLQLTEQERLDLVAFMESLTGTAEVTGMRVRICPLAAEVIPCRCRPPPT